MAAETLGIPIPRSLCSETLRFNAAKASKVLLRLLEFVDRVDRASQDGSPRPAFIGEDGQSIFPPEGHVITASGPEGFD